MRHFGRSSALNSGFWLFTSARKARSRRGESGVSHDFEELLESLNARRVRYLIGGAHALALHPRPRATKNLDLFVAPTAANSKRFILALGDFFGGTAPSCVTVDALLDPKLIVQLGVAPVRVDVLSHFATLSFSELLRSLANAGRRQVWDGRRALPWSCPAHCRKAPLRSAARSRRRRCAARTSETNQRRS